MREIKTPLIILNFKDYPESLGEGGIKLAKVAEKISNELEVSIAICPPIPYLSKYTDDINLPIFSQRIDISSNSRNTGKITAEMLKLLNVSGTLVNCSKNQISLTDLEKLVRDSRTNRLYTIVCTSNEAISAAAAKLDPNAIAFKDPQIINLSNTISSVQPNFIENNVKRIKIENPKVTAICGTGILNANDCRKAFELGIEGIIMSSVFVKSKDPYEFLHSIAGVTTK